MSPNEKRPAGNGANQESNADGITFTIPAAADKYAAHVGGGFVAVVETHPDKFRRRVFLSLKAAENHVNRARGRGQSCRIVLAELRPLYILAGTAQPPLCHDGQTIKATPGSVGSTAEGLTPSTLIPAEEALS